MKHLLLLCLVAVACLIPAAPVLAEARSTSVQLLAMAPNAGGQEVYGIRRASNEWEWSVFSNQYLKSGEQALTGGIYSLRTSLCGIYCPLNLFLQAGVGISTAGPLVELLWGSQILWLLRVDFATHLYVTDKRAVTWNYPFWVGLSLPL